MTDLLYFPGAGSFGTEFTTIGRSLPFPSTVISYPGRRGADFGQAPDAFASVVDHCVQQVSRTVEGQKIPPTLFGHSYGAYVAWETVKRLGADGTAICGLVLAGAASPAHDRSPLPVTLDEVRDYFDQMDPHVLRSAPSPEWADIICETAADDLRLLHQYRSDRSFSSRKTSIPVSVCRGEQDELVTEAALTSWGELCAGAFSSHTFAGGHSNYLTEPEFASWLMEQVQQFTDDCDFKGA